MDGRKRTDGEAEQCAGKPFAHHTTSNNFVGPADFDIFVRFENTASYIHVLDGTLTRANSVCLPALSRFDRRVLALPLVVRVGCAVLHCDVLAVLAVRW